MSVKRSVDVAEHHVLGNLRRVRDHRRRRRPRRLPSAGRSRRARRRCRASRSPCRAGAGAACSAATSRAPSRSPRRAGGPSSCARGAAAGCRGSAASPRCVGSATCTRAEAARERLVFLDVLLVLAQRGRTDHPDLAAREHRLEDVGGVGRRAERRAGADHRVRLVDEQDQVRPLLQLADDVLDPILEHPAQHRAGDHACSSAG